MRSCKSIAFLSIFFLLFSFSCPAQESRGTISGTVVDSSGAVVVGAPVKLTNVATDVSFTTTSNSVGQYRFLFLNPGLYRLQVEMAGFKSFARENIELHVNQAAAIDVTLAVGAVTETVTVSSEAPLLETEKVDRGVVVDQKRVADLPLNIRNPIMLSALSAGITHTTGVLDLNPFSNSGISSWAVNGGPANQVEFLLDGAPNNTVYGRANRIAYVPSVDAVEEFKVMTGIYDAQYGRSGGGVVNVSVKSGKNSFHGSGYEFLKRTSLNANSFSNNARPGRDGKAQPRLGNSLDQYGFSLGGPVWIPKLYQGRDRTFFFFAWEGYSEGTFRPGESTTSVPTLLQRKGDFSRTFDNAGRLITIYNPLTGRQVGNQWVRDPFPGNIIPPEMINPVGAKMASLFPEPNTSTPGSPDWQNNYFLQGNVGRFDFGNYTARIDHNFSPRQRVYGRWSYNNFEQLRIINAITGLGSSYRFGGKKNNGIVLDYVGARSNNTILNVRAALTRWLEDLRALPEQQNFDATQIGWPKELVNQIPLRNMVPRITVDQYGGLGPTDFNFEPTNVLSLQPNLAMVRGRHTIKTGLDYRLTRYTQHNFNWMGGNLSFARTFTRRDFQAQDALSGNGFASLLLGYPTGGVVDNFVRPFWQWVYYAPWVQDDIKLTRRLTINLGLRWDINTPPTERFDRMNRGFFSDVINPISEKIDQSKFPGFKARGGIGFAGKNGLPRTPWDADYNNFQPRVGAAFRFTDKTVLRGGWGVFYINPTSVGQQLGFSQSTPFVSSLDSNRTPANSLSNPFPNGILKPPGSSLGLSTFLGQGPAFSNPNASIPYIHQFSFGIQRQLPANIRLDVSYAGSRTRQMLIGKGFNEPGVEVLALGDRTKGGDPGFLNGQVPNPFQGLIPGTGLNGSTISRFQLARPFPEFGGFNVNDRNDGEIWYDSLQVELEKRRSHGLTLLVTYTLSKNIEALSYLNAQDPKPARTLTSWDRPHRLVLAPMYELPFGPGRRLLNTHRGLVNRLVGGWEVMTIGVLQSGTPMGIPSNVFLLGDPRLNNRTFDRMFKTGVIDLKPDSSLGDPNDPRFVRNVLSGEQPVFALRPPFTLRTTPLRYGNLRNPASVTFDMSLVKHTQIREGMKIEFRVEAFNAFNHPLFASNPGTNPNLDPTSPNFGKIIRENGQDNFPRNIQLGFRLVF